MRKKLLRIFLAIKYLIGLIIKQINIVEVYLKSLLSNNILPVFMKLPPNIEVFKLICFDLVCQLLYSIYGLR